jgi:hypothetical protein
MIGLSSLSHAEFSRDHGVVTDSNTKLEWQDDYSDNKGNIKYATWSDAIEYCEALSLNGKGWRLPNINELESLVDDSRYNPSIDAIFENTYSNRYWSSTSNVNNSDYAWFISFNDGNQNGSNKTYYYYVRCVRAGQ